MFFSGCQKSQPSAEDGRLAEAQVAKLTAAAENAQKIMGQIEATATSNNKLLNDLHKIHQEIKNSTAELQKTKLDAEKSVTTLRELSEQTEAIFEAVRTSTANTNQQINQLRGQLFELQLTAVREKPATLSASKKEYDLAHTDMGSFPISVEKAEPYLDGHKITFSVGNPLSASLTGAKLTIKYGKRMPQFPTDAKGQFDFGTEVQSKYQIEKDLWEKSLKTMDVNVTGSVGAGSWTSVEAILSPTKAEEVAYLQVTLESTGLAFTGLRR